MIYCIHSRNGCVEKIQGGLLNKPVKAREVLTPEQRWEDLIAELAEMGSCLVVREHTRGDIVRNVFENTN